MDNQKKPQQKTEVFGKFDSLQKLLKSYESLQSEFTKKCQRLKEMHELTVKLQQELSDLKQAALDNQAVPESEIQGENLERNEEQPLTDEKTLSNNEQLLTDNESILTNDEQPLTDISAKQAFIIQKDNSVKENADLEQALKSQNENFKQKQVNLEQDLTIEEIIEGIINDGSLFEKFINNGRIKQAVIINYLNSLNNTPARILNGTTGYPVMTPVKKPKTLLEAKKLAELLLK